MRRIGEDMAEKLDYTPGRLSVERHIRGKWVCAPARRLSPAPVIDKSIPTTSLLAQVLIAKDHDHLPLYRQESVFAGGTPSPNRPWPSGSVRWACIFSRWSMPSRPNCGPSR